MITAAIVLALIFLILFALIAWKFLDDKEISKSKIFFMFMMQGWSIAFITLALVLILKAYDPHKPKDQFNPGGQDHIETDRSDMETQADEQPRHI